MRIVVIVQNDPVNAVDPWGLWSYAAEYGTTGAGLTTNITNIENTVDNIFNNIINRDAILTYTTNGAHRPNSLHYSGNAIDLRTRDLTATQRQQTTDMLRNALGDNYDVLNEGS